MDEMKTIYGLLVIDVFLIAVISVLFMLTSPGTDCLPGDTHCLENFNENRELCQPSENVITVGNSTNYIKMRVKIYWDGEKCVTEEDVLEDHSSGIGPIDLTGYNNTCNLTLEELRKYGPHACEGSLLDFVAPPSSSTSSEGSEGSSESEPPFIYCSMNDTECHMKISDYVNNCEPLTAEATQIIGQKDGISYMTYYLELRRQSTDCVLKFKVLNIVNLPPEIPPEIEGMGMTCTASLSLFPRDGIEKEWCKGDLIEYFDSLYRP
ncbi:MAG: hypothetical protein J7K54_04965 [Candidatus Aenigmarchaeota archaeon]|nr:hypothetical protein [Candidatus Aenigmarchaeota archaeon]